MIIENSKNSARLIDGFISELFIAINVKSFNQENAYLETKFAFDPFEIRIDYTNKVEGQFLLEDREEPMVVNRIFLEDKSLQNSRTLIEENQHTLEVTESSTSIEPDEFDKLFQQQQEEEKGTYEKWQRPEIDNTINILLHTDCHRLELRVHHKYLSTQQRKLLSKLTVLNNRSHQSGDHSNHKGLKSVIVNSIYIDSTNTPADPIFLSDPFKVVYSINRRAWLQASKATLHGFSP